MRHPNWKFIALVLMVVPLGCNLDSGTLGNGTGSGGSRPSGSGGAVGCGDPAGGGNCGQSKRSDRALVARHPHRAEQGALDG